MNGVASWRLRNIFPHLKYDEGEMLYGAFFMDGQLEGLMGTVGPALQNTNFLLFFII